MERDIQLDWPEVVEEARRRRKEHKMSLRRLAAVANVSLPTVLRFEKNEQDIQLSSVLAILKALGMVARKIEGTLLIRTAADGSRQAMFAPSAGAGRELERRPLPTDQASLQAFYNQLGVHENAQRLAEADLVRTGTASVTGLLLSPRRARELWPSQFSENALRDGG